MGRKPKKEGVYIYRQPIHFAVWQRLTQHCEAIKINLKNIFLKCKIWKSGDILKSYQMIIQFDRLNYNEQFPPWFFFI